MKKALIIISVIAALVAAYIALFPKNNVIKNLFSKKPGNNSGNGTAAGAVQTQNVASQSSTPAGFPLKEGSRGMYVINLQSALNKYFGASLVTDGIFGPKTAAAVSAVKFDPENVTYTDYLDILNG